MTPRSKPRRFPNPVHILAGVISALSANVHPSFPFITSMLFIAYELDQDWHIKDGAYKDIVEYVVAFFLATAVLSTLRFLGYEP